MQDDFDDSIFTCQECGSEIEGYSECMECYYTNLSDDNHDDSDYDDYDDYD